MEQDFNRVQQQTVSQKQKKTVKMDKGDNLTLNQNRGFTVEQLFSDIRYRLGAALYVPP